MAFFGILINLQVIARRTTKLTELNLLSMFGESFVKVRILR
jgi:hypothetical protein